MDTSDYNKLIDTLAFQLAHAIALAEGDMQEGSLPQRINNPGDLELGDRGWGVIQCKTVYLKADPMADIDDKTDGFSALRRECTAILTGASLVYSPSDMIEDVARKWTGGDNPGAWCRIVTEYLNLSPIDRLMDWVHAENSRLTES